MFIFRFLPFSTVLSTQQPVLPLSTKISPGGLWQFTLFPISDIYGTQELGRTQQVDRLLLCLSASYTRL